MFFLHRVAVHIYNILTYQTKKNKTPTTCLVEIGKDMDVKQGRECWEEEGLRQPCLGRRSLLARCHWRFRLRQRRVLMEKETDSWILRFLSAIG